MNITFDATEKLNITYLKVELYLHSITRQGEEDWSASKRGTVGWEGARAGMLVFNATDVALGQHQHSPHVLHAAVSER